MYAETKYPDAPAKDSAISDANGRVSFRYLKNEANRGIYTNVSGYLYPFYTAFYGVRLGPNVDRTDSIILARPSYINLILHQSTTYASQDTINLTVSGYRRSILPFDNQMGRANIFWLQRKAMASDSVLNIPSVYFAPPYQKVYFNWDIVRNGSPISSGSDSTDLIQFATKNYSINY